MPCSYDSGMSRAPVDRGRRMLAEPVLIDAALALCAALLGSISLRYHVEAGEIVAPAVGPAPAVSYVLLWVLCALLLFRRVAPIASFLSTVMLFCGMRLVDVPEPTITVMVLAGNYVSVGVYGAARWRDPARWFATIVFVAVYVTEAVRLSSSGDLEESFRTLLVFDVAFSVAIIASAWFIGEVVRSRGELTRTLEARTRQLEAERERAARLAVADERLRIARDLHDVLAHHVSVMGLQAVAADRVLDRRPDDARIALGIIERSSRAAVDEMQQLVGLLRGNDDAPTRRPSPTLAQMDELVSAACSGGLLVDVVVTGDPSALAPGVELASYRIVQEALTNVQKHSNATEVTITLDYRSDRFVLTVLDNGQPAPSDAGDGGGGMGLIGMSERVRLNGGTLSAGDRPDGGFEVRASFPTRVGP